MSKKWKAWLSIGYVVTLILFAWALYAKAVLV